MFGKLVGQETETGQDTGPAPTTGCEALDMHDQGVARFGTIHIDRTGQRINTGGRVMTELVKRRLRCDLTARGFLAVELDRFAWRNGQERLKVVIPAKVVMLLMDRVSLHVGNRQAINNIVPILLRAALSYVSWSDNFGIAPGTGDGNTGLFFSGCRHVSRIVMANIFLYQEKNAMQNTTSRQEEKNWHAMPVDGVLAAQNTDDKGLSGSEAERRLAEYGENRLPEPPRSGPISRFLSQFNNLLIYVLIGAAVITLLLGHLIDTGVILAVVVINAVIGFIQEGKAEQAMDAIRRMLAPMAAVVRDGQRHAVAGHELVPGDVVLLEAGDRVPADLRLLRTHGLMLQEAVLTGESVAVEKGTGPVDATAPLGDRTGMAFSGTLVSSGQGRGVVVATGSNTQIGRISGMLAEVQTLTTPLLRQMSVFAKWLTGFILLFAFGILLFGVFIRGMDITELFMAVVGLSVAAIPEGLPAILTVTLAIGVQAMARRNAIIRRLPAIETLGAVSVICSDKTGTLTRNEMMVATVATGTHRFTVSGVGYEPDSDIALDTAVIEPSEYPLLSEMARAAVLCNDAELRHRDGNWTVQGDPMEGALLSLGRKIGYLEEDQRAQPRTDTIPFDSAHRFMATLHHDHEGHGFAYVKGAPERVLAMCSGQRTADGDTVSLDIDDWHACADGIAAEGQRVLALAMREMPADKTALELADVEQELVLLGLVGLIDPPRPEAIDAVKECRSAGISVKMITGDHAGTAAAIARQLGLEHADTVLTGAELDDMDDETLREQVIVADVFARTSPEHKLRLIRALQADGQVIAMTGDGVNDAPALKRADVGIAMGRKGSEAAKEAAEIVLADDNFASIVAAVRGGRNVYDNLKKAIAFLLPVNGGESFSLILAILLGVTLPISPLQILWVNMVSSVALAMALAFEPAEPGVMKRPPRAAGEPILSPFLIWRIALVSVLFCVGIFGQYELALMTGADMETARTMAVNTLVVMEIFYLFSIRYIHGTSVTLRGIVGTPAVLIAITTVTLLQFLFTYTPFMALFFESRPLSIEQGLQVIAVGVVLLMLLEIEKAIVRGMSARTPEKPA